MARSDASEAQKKAQKKWDAEHLRQIKLSIPIQEAEDLSFFCEKKGYKKASFIRRAIKEQMKREENV